MTGNMFASEDKRFWASVRKEWLEITKIAMRLYAKDKDPYYLEQAKFFGSYAKMAKDKI